MPISPGKLFLQVGLAEIKTVQWGKLPDTSSPGVYALSLCSDPMANSNTIPHAPIELGKVAGWIARVPNFQFRDTLQPSAQTVADFLRLFWLDDECIIYIGKATNLKTRLGQYRGHTLGNRSPHAGGHWVKTLAHLDGIYIHFCNTETVQMAEQKEHEALTFFKSQVSSHHVNRFENVIPFANREHPKGRVKQSVIRADVLRNN